MMTNGANYDNVAILLFYRVLTLIWHAFLLNCEWMEYVYGFLGLTEGLFTVKRLLESSD